MNLLLKALLPYVINGLAISPVGSPVVKIELINENGQSYFCSGSLISEKKILTAGHCISPYRGIYPQPLAVGAVVEIEGITYSSNQFKIHPKFKPYRGYNYDLSIITLSEPVVGNIPRLKLDTSKVKKRASYIVVGYGYSNGLTDPEYLRIGTIFFDWWTKELLFSYLRESESSACFGDSGGPVLSDKGIIAVVTGGERQCDRIGAQSLYARMNNRHNRQFVKQFGR